MPGTGVYSTLNDQGKTNHEFDINSALQVNMAVHKRFFDRLTLLAGQHNMPAIKKNYRTRGPALRTIDEQTLLFRLISYTPRE